MNIFRFDPLAIVVNDLTRSARRRQRIPRLLAVILLSLSVVASLAQSLHDQDAKHPLDFATIVVFGDSLSDTGNVSDLSETKYGVRIPGPYADYTDGRFTDGADTEPAAENYFGVWIEQLAATFPSKPVVAASLDGGTDYAYGFAFTGKGTSVFTFGKSDSLSVNVNNLGQQITDYLATDPVITEKTLFVVWGGANDVLNATTNNEVIDAAVQQVLNVHRLIEAGARHFIVPNLPPLGSIPRLNGSPTTSVPATKAARLYNQTLARGLELLRVFHCEKHIEMAQLDVFTLFDKIIAKPASFALTNVTDSSQAMAVDPDTYLFWDGLHPTTHGHNILAEQARKVLARARTEMETQTVLSNIH